MEELNLKQMTAMVKAIADEKDLPEETVLEAVEMAIAAAWRRDNGTKDMNVRAELNTKTGEANVFVIRAVVADDTEYNEATEIPESEAGGKKIGDIVEEKFTVTSFGRVASITAKQVLIQTLRTAERDVVIANFEDKVGTIVTATVAHVNPKLVRFEVGQASGIMPKSEQIEGEYYTIGARLKVLVKSIERDEKGAQLILSRGAPEFVKELFIQEVPEVENGSVEIKGIAREAGRRTKIAVAAKVPGVDPVGTFVGGRGIRVQAVMNEVGEREKIDIVSWSENLPEYIREALSPAEIAKIELSKDEKSAKVFVSEDQQSIAIGRAGQNVRLASKLTGVELNLETMKIAPKKKPINAEDALLEAIENGEREMEAAEIVAEEEAVAEEMIEEDAAGLEEELPE